MGTKVEQPSTAEPHSVQSPVTANTSAASSGTKISMFGAKSGFVIPKNKLSGSLVPIFRGGKKGGTSDVVNEENNKQLQRKTKWAPDLTQDAAVRKGRALAYQTRVDQITERLKSGFLDTEDSQESVVAAQHPDLKSSVCQKSELLEIERREAIGEILKLNPSYKPPSDYKPLLKEAKVPVSIKEYPGYNFIGVIFGPLSDTQRRLEKETGAKVRVYGTKANTGEKAEITQSDANEAHGAYEDLYVHVCADTYEKVDAAVALIELLVKPLSVNQATVSTTPTSVSGGDVNIVDQTQGTAAPYMIPPVGANQELPQSITGSAQTPVQTQFQPHPGSWFSLGSPQAPIRQPSGFILPPNPLAPTLTTSTSSNMPSLFGPKPLLQRPFMSHGHFGPSQSPSLPGVSTPAPFICNQPSSTGFSPIVRPSGPSLSQPMSITQMGPPLAPPRGPHPVSPQPIASGPITFSNGPPPVSSFVPNRAAAPMSAPNLIPSSSPVASMHQVMLHHATPSPTPIAPPVASTSTPPPPLQARTPNSFPGNAPSFTPMQSPPLTTQKLHRPNSDNFTFQPQRPQNLALQAVPRPMIQNMPAPLQNPSFRPVIHTSSPRPILQGISRPPMNQIRSQIPFFPENSTVIPQVGPRNLFPIPPSSHVPQVGPRNLNPTPHMANLGIPFPPRPGTTFHSQQNFPSTNRPHNVFAPNLQLGSNISISIRPASGSGAQQVYDPFSPTSVSAAPLQGVNLGTTRKQESDPEYEDLMASVGVK